MNAPPVVADELPTAARKIVVNNVTSGGGPWVLVNLSGPSPVVVPSKLLNRTEWIEAFSAIQKASEYATRS